MSRKEKEVVLRTRRRSII